MSEWLPIKGDGRDTIWPELWKLFDARLRNGVVWKDCAMTPFDYQCGPPGRYWKHGNLKGEPRDFDVMAIRYPTLQNAPEYRAISTQNSILEV